MYDPVTEGDVSYEDAYAQRPTKKTKTYTNDPNKAHVPPVSFLAKLQAYVELLAGNIAFFALLATVAIAAGDVATGGFFSHQWPNLPGVWGVCSVLGIDTILIGTLAAAAWAGRQRHWWPMIGWFVTSIPSGILTYIQLRVYALEQVTHANEVQALHSLGMSALDYANFRTYAALALLVVAPWVAKEAWFRMKQLPVVRTNQHDGFYKPRNQAKVRRTKNGKGTMAPVSTPMGFVPRKRGSTGSVEGIVREAYGQGHHSVNKVVASTGVARASASKWLNRIKAEQGR